MRTTPKLRAYLRRLRRKAPPPPPQAPRPGNAYHRCFSAHRRFEQLAPARKNPPAGR